MLSSSILLALVAPGVHAAPLSVNPFLVESGTDLLGGELSVTTSDDGAPTAVVANVASAAGRETLSLVASDTWLHGGATIPTLPTVDAHLTLTVYDSGGVAFAHFMGALGRDASISLVDDGTGTADVQVLAVEIFASEGGYDVGLDLNGADTLEVAYAELTISETTGECMSRVCETEPVTTVTTAEVGWDDLGIVWRGTPTLEHAGLLSVRAQSYDAARTVVATARATLAVPWRDGGYGTNALVTDTDPLTSVALLSDQVHGNGTEWEARVDTSGCGETGAGRFLSVVSSGWGEGAAIPAEVQVVVTTDTVQETQVIPLNSLQRTPSRPGLIVNVVEGDLLTLTINGGNLLFNDSATLTLLDLAAPVCVNGTCVAITESGGRYELSVTGYSDTLETLPGDTEVVITVVDVDGAERSAETFLATLDGDITAVFANEVCLAQDPLGLDFTGQVNLLSAPKARGQQKVLTRGQFFGSFIRDPDGDLALAGIDRAAAIPKGDILIGGEPIDFELTTDDDGDGVINGPPVVVMMTTGNGKGTRAVATGSNGSPGLL